MTSGKLVALGLALGLALRWGYARHAYVHGGIPSFSDHYETIALSLLERGEYSITPGVPTAWREPALPLIIAGTYAVLGGRHPRAFLALQGVVSVATAWLVLLMGRKLFSEPVAQAAFWAYLLYPTAIYYCGYFFREAFMSFLFTALVYGSLFWSAPEDHPKASLWAFVSGLLAAAWSLANSANIPAAMLAGAGLWAVAPPAARVKRASLFFLPLLLGLSLWTARNYNALGLLVAGSTHGGEEFYQALLVPPDELGTPRQNEIVQNDPTWQKGESMPEAEHNAFMLAASLSFIQEHPGLFISRAFAGFLKFWKLWPYPRKYNHSYPLLVAISLLTDGWMVPLGFLGLWLFRARWREIPAFPAGLFALTFVFGCVHAIIRYRTPLMPCMILLAMGAAVELRAKYFTSQGK